MMVNDAGRTHFLKVLKEGFRYDRRKIDEYRELTIIKGCSKTAEGSAEVKLGKTHVMAGVKFGLEAPFPDTPDEGILMVNVEESPVASPEFEVGPPSIEAIELARVVDRGLRESKLVDLKELCVKEGEKVWFISIDIVTINDDGNLLDACGLAALAALQDAKFPKVVDGEVDYHETTNKGLELKKIPIPVTIYKYGDHLLIDPTHDEEIVADARLTVTTVSSGDICALQKAGEGRITTQDVEKMVELSLKKGEELRKVLEKTK